MVIPFTATDYLRDGGRMMVQKRKRGELEVIQKARGSETHSAERRGFFHSHKIEDQFRSWGALSAALISQGNIKNKADILGRHMHRNTRSRSSAGLRRPQENHQFRICNNVLEVEQVGWFRDFLKGNGHDFVTVRLKQDRSYLHPRLDFLLGK